MSSEPKISGRLEVYREPEPGERYLFAIDPAEGLGESGDWTYGCGFNRRTFEHVLSFSTQMREGPAAAKIYEVACRYNDALTVIERNKGMALIGAMEAQPRLARATPQDGETLHPRARMYYDADDKPGLCTTAALRPVLFSTLDKAIRDGSFKTRDRLLLAQLRAIITDHKTGRPTAPTKKRKDGVGDDGVLAAAIGVYVLMQGRNDAPYASSGGESYGFGDAEGRGY